MSRPIRWVPREHGAWAILAVPLLLGIIAAGPRPAHLLLGAAAVSAYLFSVPAIEWIRTRRHEHVPPAAVFGLGLAASGVPLVVAHPDVLPIAGAAGLASLVAIALVVAGWGTSVLVSLVQVAQAILLVPAAAAVAGTLGEPSTARAAAAAAIYLAGTVFVVRSLIRGRGNAWFFAASVAFHVTGLVVAAIVLPLPYAVLAAALLARAVALPIVQARLATGPRRLKPIHIGMVEIAASVALIGAAVTAGF